MPVTPEYVTYVIERERPDGIMVSLSSPPAKGRSAKMVKASVRRTGQTITQYLEGPILIDV